jgi:dTDP-L-rhamnose 4-epimerase
MADRILITGGGGFIGSHLADELLACGYEVCALDSLSPQVHAAGSGRPDYLNREVEFFEGDVRDPVTVERALQGVDGVFHLAAAVGVGQSMYEIASYTAVNNLGTAVLLEALIKRPVKKLVVASSMSIYGEGVYRRSDGTAVAPLERPLEQLRRNQWELMDHSGETLEPIPTPESKPASPSSVYALSKYDQERLCLIIGRAYRIPTAAMRFFNVYGPRQALSNPYTGVMAIFASRLLNEKAPLIFEDGQQRRDFVSVYDIALACRLAYEQPAAADQVFNVGSGRSSTVAEIADKMAAALGKDYLEPEVTGKCRQGDVRHCFADISRARDLLGYEPRIRLEDGMAELAGWLEGQIADDRVEAAGVELAKRGLTL